ncbi:TPA: phosphotransferase [Klebsiella variicola subsp. variicola]|uniref:phosphotransferase n=1 Tax=Klebsiella sp. JB_Kp010 TaxID=3153363 RepID=UPI0032B4700B|nr:phosphotransferase [Klebsiella variicola subsp. variicola]HCI6746664.1 phosphotransferase [Klebsiella variicola subsp. variicola]
MSLMTNETLFGNMANVIIPTPVSIIQQFVRDGWGIDLPCRVLSCERDELFLIGEEHTARYILRLSNPADNPDIITMQTDAIRWIERHASDIPVPGVIPARSGLTVLPAELGGNSVRMASLTTFLTGSLLATFPATLLQMKQVGRVLAGLDRALTGFDHPGAHRVLAWDVAQAERCRVMLPDCEGTDSASRWNLVREGFDTFIREIQPRLRQLRSQVIHADFNPYNILMASDNGDVVTGVLDFGDMVYSPLINNIAIAASYQIASEQPLQYVVAMLAAYHQRLPLNAEEIDLLYDLMITRLCMAVTITEHRARQYPENRQYILKNTGTAWRGLQRLATIHREDACAIFHRACHISLRSE